MHKDKVVHSATWSSNSDTHTRYTHNKWITVTNVDKKLQISKKEKQAIGNIHFELKRYWSRNSWYNRILKHLTKTAFDKISIVSYIINAIPNESTTISGTCFPMPGFTAGMCDWYYNHEFFYSVEKWYKYDWDTTCMFFLIYKWNGQPDTCWYLKLHYSQLII